MGTSHPLSVGSNNHAITANPNATGASYADIAARDADTAFQITTNINKVVRVESPLSFFILSSIGPAVWVAVAALDPVDSFLELSDTPSSYSGEALKIVSVNAGETALEFTLDSSSVVLGPISSTDNSVPTFDMASGKLLQDKAALFISDDLFVGVHTFTTPPLSRLHIRDDVASGATVPLNTIVTIENDGDAFISFETGNEHSKGIVFGDTADNDIGSIIYDIEDNLKFTTNANERMRIEAGGQVGIGTGAPDTSAILHLDSTTKGFLPTRMTTTQRDAIPSPATGLLVDDTSQNGLFRWSGTAWVNMVTTGDVFGPVSSADGSVVTFSGVTGKIIQDPAQINLSQSGSQNFLTLKVSGKDAIVELDGDHTTPTAGQIISRINSFDQSSTGITRQYTSILSQAATTTNAAEDGKLSVLALVDGINTTLFEIDGSIGSGIIHSVVPMGIGIAVPLFDLHIAQPTQDDPSFIMIADTFPRLQLGFMMATVPTNGQSNAQIFADGTAGNLHISSRTDGASQMVFYTGDTGVTRERIRITGGSLINTKVGINIALPDGTLHVHRATAGSVASFTNTILTVENSGDAYISLLVPDANTHGILFGNPINNQHGGIFYTVADGFQFRTGVNITKMNIQDNGFVVIGDGSTTPDARLHVIAGNAGAVSVVGGVTMVLESNTSNFLQFQYPNASGAGLLFGDVDVDVAGAFSYSTTDDFSWSTINNTVKMFLKSDGSLGIRTSDPKARIHVLNNASSGVTPSVNASDIFVEHTFNSGMTIGTGNTGIGRFGFGDPENNLAGSILYNHNNDFMSISSLAAIQLNAQESQFLCAISYERTEIADVNKTVLAREYLLAITSITAARTITFNSSVITGSGIPGQAQHWPIKDESGDVSGTNTVTIATQSTETIDGATSLVLDTPFFDLVIYSDGNDLFVRSA